MRPEEAILGLLWDMREAARAALRFTESLNRDEFLADEQVRMAVERALEIIGEAARRVSPEFRAAHPEVPWQDIVGQRNVLAHEYGTIDRGRVWDTVRQDLPALISMLDVLIPPIPDDDD